MRGYPRFNFDAFAEAAARLRALGHEVLSPAENDLAMGFDPDGPLEALDLPAAFRWDVQALLSADAVALMPKWHMSEGARLEFDIAKAIGTPAYPLEQVPEAAEPEPEPEAERLTVPDLMAALEESLAAMKSSANPTKTGA